MSVILVNAEAGRVPLPDGVVHCVVTSPPYWGLRDYSLPPLVWDGDPDCRHVWGDELVNDKRDLDTKSSTLEGPQREDTRLKGNGNFCSICRAWRGCLGQEPDIDLYVSHMVQVFREVRRVLHPTGTVWLNLGDSYSNDTKWGGQSGGKNYTSAAGGYQGQRQKRDTGLKPKDLCMIPARVALALQADGWWLRSQIIWHKPNCMPESVTDRPTTSHEYVFLLAKSERYFYDAEAIKVPASENTHSKGQQHITPKSTEPGQGIRQNHSFEQAIWDKVKTRNRRTVWTIPTYPFSGTHFATFPPALIEPMIKAGCPCQCCSACGTGWAAVVEKERSFESGSGKAGNRPNGKYKDWEGTGLIGNDLRMGPTITTTILDYRPTCECGREDWSRGVVLDPFFGSGTTGLVARELGVDCIGLDLSYDYLSQQARARLGFDAWDAWHQGRDGDVVGDLEGLPLFEGVE